MRSLTLRSPAKLNLYLKVLNKRKDGYHNLETLFERIDLYDELTLKPNSLKKIRIICNHPSVPCGPKNLVHKVAAHLRDKFALENGVDIAIKKRIPVAAGLAGGSSNAATTLLGLNKLWKLSLKKSEMVDIAKQIGADVPFFLYNSSWAVGTKRGDAIKPLKMRTKVWHILVVPKMKMYSRKVFESLKLQSKSHPKKGPNNGSKSRQIRAQNGSKPTPTNVLTKRGDNVNILIHYLKKSNVNDVGQLLLNDLEISSFRLCSKLSELKNRLLQLGVLGAALSGSGPSVYGLVRSKKEAEILKKILLKRYSQVFVVKTF